MTLQGDLLMKGNGAHDGFIERSFSVRLGGNHQSHNQKH
jgi:hypothetical protein